MRSGRALFIAALVAAAPAFAATIEGAEFPPTRQAGGATLVLNGAGLRSMAVVKVYAAGLYLQEPTTDAAEAVRSDQVKRVELHMLRDLSKEQVAGTIEEAFVRNSGADLSALRGRLDRLLAAIPAVREGQRLTVTIVPGKGTTIEGPNMTPLTLEGEDFSQALLRVWLGEQPVDQRLKAALLAGGGARSS